MDITKCPGTNCPMKEACYRYTAPTSEFRQSWFVDVPVTFFNGKPACDHYWNNKDYQK